MYECFINKRALLEVSFMHIPRNTNDMGIVRLCSLICLQNIFHATGFSSKADNFLWNNIAKLGNILLNAVLFGEY